MAMTENSRKVFEFLKANQGVKIVARDIANELSITINAVTGSVNGLVKKGYAVREQAPELADGKVVKYISLTEAGLGFDPDAVVEKAE